MDKISILLIEDNDISARYTSKLLERADSEYIIDRTCNLECSFENLKNNKYDIILLDLMLPNSIGLETFNSVYEKVKLPIIIISAYADIAVEAVRIGAEDYLIKGEINSSLLDRSIRYAIERNKKKIMKNEIIENEIEIENKIIENDKRENKEIFQIIDFKVNEWIENREKKAKENKEKIKSIYNFITLGEGYEW